MPTHPPAPMVLSPILMPKVWGGRRLEAFGKLLPPAEMIGESWEACDLGATSASGGGGAEARSRIASGPHAGRTLHDVMHEMGDDFFGAVRPTPAGDFPLLVKFLDAREHLSVQVHPSPAYAKANPGAHLKTECWFILDASPGAGGAPPVIYKGLRPGVTIDDLRVSASAQTTPDLLEAVEVRPGELHDLPSGTMHALGAGVLVAEVQTPSDTTFRVYDWAREYGREGRELHIEQSLACVDTGPAPVASRLPDQQQRGVLLANEFFTVEQLRLAPAEQVALDGLGTCAIAMTLDGSGSIARQPIAKGDTLAIPASCSGIIEAGGHGLSLLLATPR